MTGLNKITLLDFIEQLNKTKLPVLVEGKNDKKALINIGVVNPVYTLSGKPLYKVAEQLSDYKEIIFLFDNDKAGHDLSSKMAKEFSRLGVRVNKRFQTLLKRLHFAHVEGIQ